MASCKDQSQPAEGREAPGPMLSFDVSLPAAGVGPISQAPRPLDNLTPAGAGGRVWRLGVGVLTSRRHLPHTLEESEAGEDGGPRPSPTTRSEAATRAGSSKGQQGRRGARSGWSEQLQGPRWLLRVSSFGWRLFLIYLFLYF